ncbi:uncharacterized protein LOC135680554 isoform X1 [Musa acuminata AAA Group]|uniref:uncharacterized protein LOC135680554 isoform X1 n=2 Tax=Musa acuminata AAA Group TaxID=214697 RepID=UPI0031E0E4EA
MPQSSRPRRREEPHPSAAEFGRHPVPVSAARAEGQFHFRRQPNPRDAICSACINGLSVEENSFALEIRQTSSKKGSGMPIKELIDKEVSKEKEIRHPLPSLIARLMGLDTLPSSVRPQRSVDSCCRTTMPRERNHVHPEDWSQWRSSGEGSEFKDVFEVMEASKNREQQSHSDSRVMLRCQGNGADTDFVRQKVMDMKSLSNNEVLQNSKEFNDAFDSSKDLLIGKHRPYVNCAPSSPHRSKITILKPSKGTKHWSNEVWCNSSKIERNHDWCSHMQQEVTGSFKMYPFCLNECSIGEISGSLSQHSSASRDAGISETHVDPARIVILKPSLEKAQKMAEASSFAHEDFLFSSKRGTGIAASRIQVLQYEGRDEHLSHHTQVSNHKVKGSREIATENTRKTRHSISSCTKKNLTSKMNPYPGTEDSFMTPGESKLSHSEAVCQNPDPFGEWSNSFSPSYLYSTEYSSREAHNRLSERWKTTHQFQKMGLIARGSSTLGEMCVQFDRDTPKVTVDMINTKNFSYEKFTSNDSLKSKGCHWVHGADARRDGSSRFLPKTLPHPVSYNLQLSDRERDGGSCTNMIKDVPDMGASVSSVVKFSKLEVPLMKSPKHQYHNSKLAHSVGEETMLTKHDIHVNSEGLWKKIHVKSFLDKTVLHPAPTDDAITERNQLAKGASIPIDTPWHLTTQMVPKLSAFQVPSENEGLFGHIQTVVIEEKSSDQPQEKLLPCESDMAKPHPLGSEELDQPSPSFVLETPSEDGTYSSGCFERLSADLKELRVQLQCLKLESVATSAESDEDCAGDNHVLLPSMEVHREFSDVDDRDFTYLLDVLIESGVRGTDDNRFSDAFYSRGHPVNQSVFDKLEKKYDGVASWPRSERKLLFDLINCTLAGLITPYMDVHLWMTSLTLKICVPAWDREGLVEAVWQMVVKQRKELHCNQENMLLESGWFGVEYGVDLVGMEMERMLNADLLEELICEFVLL